MNKKNYICPLCKKNNPKELGRVPDSFHFCNLEYKKPLYRSKLLNCNFCGISYKYPLPSSKELLKLYSKADLSLAWGLNINKRTDYFKVSELILDLNPKNILEIGCYSGTFFDFLKENGSNNEFIHNWYGVEPSKKAYKYCSEKGISIISSDLSKIDKKKYKNFFELIVAIDVFEHITNLNDFIKDCKKILKQDGILLLSTGNASSIPLNFQKYWNYVCMPEHFCFLSSKTTKFICSNFGFELRSFTKFRHISNITLRKCIKLYLRSIFSILINFLPSKLLSKRLRVISSIGWLPLFKKDHCVVCFVNKHHK